MICWTACRQSRGPFISTTGTCEGFNFSGQKSHKADKDGCWGDIADLILKLGFPEPDALSGVSWSVWSADVGDGFWLFGFCDFVVFFFPFFFLPF